MNPLASDRRKQRTGYTMDLKNLFETDGDERAVSPVIGVILMVAITVILAAVIGAFVIGIGDEQAAQPTVSFDWDQSSDTVELSHQSGDTIQENEIEINVDGGDGGDIESGDPVAEWSDKNDPNDEIGAGASVSFHAGANNDADVELDDGDGTITVVWESSDTDQSSVLTDFDYDIDT